MSSLINNTNTLIHVHAHSPQTEPDPRVNYPPIYSQQVPIEPLLLVQHTPLDPTPVSPRTEVLLISYPPIPIRNHEKHSTYPSPAQSLHLLSHTQRSPMPMTTPIMKPTITIGEPRSREPLEQSPMPATIPSMR